MFEIVRVQVVSADLQEHTHVHLGVRMMACMRVWLCFWEVKSTAFCLSPAKCLNPGEQARAGS